MDVVWESIQISSICAMWYCLYIGDHVGSIFRDPRCSEASVEGELMPSIVCINTLVLVSTLFLWCFLILHISIAVGKSEEGASREVFVYMISKFACSKLKCFWQI